MSDVANKESYQQIKNKLQIRSIDNEQNLTGTAAAPSLAFGDRNTGFYEISDNVLGVSTNGTEAFNINATQTVAGGNVSAWALLNEAVSATNPTILPRKTDGNTGIGSAGADELSLIAGGVEGLRVTASGISGISGLNAVCNEGNIVCNEGEMVFN